jgi:hypothetical protein
VLARKLLLHRAWGWSRKGAGPFTQDVATAVRFQIRRNNMAAKSSAKSLKKAKKLEAKVTLRKK